MGQRGRVDESAANSSNAVRHDPHPMQLIIPAIKSHTPKLQPRLPCYHPEESPFAP